MAKSVPEVPDGMAFADWFACRWHRRRLVRGPEAPNYGVVRGMMTMGIIALCVAALIGRR